MKYILVIFLTLLGFSYGQAAKTPILRSVFKPLSKNSDQIELIRLYQDKSFEHLVYTPDREFKRGVNEAIYYKVIKNTGKYSLESGKLKMNCLDKNFPCKLYGLTLFIDNSKVYDNRFRALFKKKEFVLRSTSKEKYSQPYFMDPENGRIVTNEGLESEVDVHDIVRYLIKGETEGRFKIKTLVAYLRENIQIVKEETEVSDQLVSLLVGKNRRAGSQEIARLFAEMLKIAGLPTNVVEGELKSTLVNEYNNKTKHFWNKVRVGNNDQLFDVSLGESWMNVDPAIMIHSHFPEDESHQLLETPLTKEQFNRLAYSAPTRENAKYASILPAKGEVHFKEQMEILFPSGLSIVNMDIIPIGTENATHTRAQYTSSTFSGKTKIMIPIKEKNALLKVRFSSGLELTYRVYNDGIKDDEIDGYYEELRLIAAANRKVNVVENVSVTNQRISVTLPAVFSLNSRFRSDVLGYEMTDFTGFDHPMIRAAVSLYGTKEIPGAKNNPQIVEFFQSTGNRNIHDDETHWCSAFIMYCARMNGFDYPKNALARSWMKVGKKVDKPQVGDLVVFGWEESYRGHVAIYLGESNGMIICLGGNQADEVNVTLFSKMSILGYRRLN
ncbi:MAG: TIGR02594 family protein [Flavobacteriia bacterium]|jgi:uncharacterized protein (TIGR02594 family)